MTPEEEAEARERFEQAKRVHNELIDLLGSGPPGHEPEDPYWEVGTDFQDLYIEVVGQWKREDPDFPSDMPASPSAYVQTSGRSSKTASASSSEAGS